MGKVVRIIGVESDEVKMKSTFVYSMLFAWMKHWGQR